MHKLKLILKSTVRNCVYNYCILTLTSLASGTKLFTHTSSSAAKPNNTLLQVACGLWPMQNCPKHIMSVDGWGGIWWHEPDSCTLYLVCLPMPWSPAVLWDNRRLWTTPTHSMAFLIEVYRVSMHTSRIEVYHSVQRDWWHHLFEESTIPGLEQCICQKCLTSLHLRTYHFLYSIAHDMHIYSTHSCN